VYEVNVGDNTPGRFGGVQQLGYTPEVGGQNGLGFKIHEGTCADRVALANVSYDEYSKILLGSTCVDAGWSAEITGGTGTSSLSEEIACMKGIQNKDSSTYDCSEFLNARNADGSPVADRQYKDACLWGMGAEVDVETPEAPESADVPETSCAVGGIGWVVCPVMEFMGNVADNVYGFLADQFLEFDGALVDGANGAWGVMRNLANIAFVIAFIVIVFSQLTSIGVTNYGIKKLLPRVIIAAILVNLSFIICQLAVDLSNLLGYGLKALLDSPALAPPTLTDNGGAGTAGAEVPVDGFAGWAVIVTAVLAGAAVIYFALPFLATMLIATVVGVLFIALLLVARKVLIVLLIVISPLAFVAFLLPNTEGLFTKWRKLFVGLLMLFPVVGVLFGAGALAGKILAGISSDMMIQISAGAASVLPLFAVWPVLKGSLNGIGTLGARINGAGAKLSGKAGSLGGAGQRRLMGVLRILDLVEVDLGVQLVEPCRKEEGEGLRRVVRSERQMQRSRFLLDGSEMERHLSQTI
jgi:hypothetical protein